MVQQSTNILLADGPAYLAPCSIAAGNVYQWACSSGYGNFTEICINSTSLFKLVPGNIAQTKITGRIPSSTSSSTSSIASVTTSTACVTTTSSPESNSMVAVGAGVGVPLGILFLLALATALWYRRKWLGGQGSNAAMISQPASTQHASGEPWTALKRIKRCKPSHCTRRILVLRL